MARNTQPYMRFYKHLELKVVEANIFSINIVGYNKR